MKSRIARIAWPLSLIALLTVGAVVAQAQDEEPAAEPQIIAAFGTDLDRPNRALLGEGTVFPAGVERIWCLTRIQGLSAPTTVTHAWYHEGESKARVELNVGSSDWRTWSSKRILPAWTGAWEVKVLDESGKVLGTYGFTIE